MKQVRIHGPNLFQLDEVPRPAPGPDDVLVRVAACGICGSDIGYVALGGASGPADSPMPLGHELSGDVAAIGSNVKGLSLGTRVVVNPMAANNLIGNGGLEGGFAPFVLVRNVMADQSLYPIPDTLPFEIAALAEPLAVAFHAVNRAEVRPQTRVTVFGAGPIGLGIVVGLRRRGVTDIVVVDLSPRRLELARRLGASVTVNPAVADVRDTLSQCHGVSELFGWPVVNTDVFIDASGAPNVIQDVVAMCRYGARLVVVAVHKHPIPVDFRLVLAKELVITGAIGYPVEFPEVVEMLGRGETDVSPLISHRFAFDDFEQAFARARDPSTSLKVVVEFPVSPL